MLEYKVVSAHDFMTKPDEKRAEKACQEAARDGWRLVAATASVTHGAIGTGGRLLLFFEREAR